MLSPRALIFFPLQHGPANPCWSISQSCQEYSRLSNVILLHVVLLSAFLLGGKDGPRIPFQLLVFSSFAPPISQTLLPLQISHLCTQGINIKVNKPTMSPRTEANCWQVMAAD